MGQKNLINFILVAMLLAAPAVSASQPATQLAYQIAPTAVCEIGKIYENTAVKPISCACPDGYVFKTIETSWGPCPAAGMKDCIATKIKCVAKTAETPTITQNPYIASTTLTKTLEITATEIVETTKCPVGCKCYGDTVACPVPPTLLECAEGCTLQGDTCTCPADKGITCTAHLDEKGCTVVECADGTATKTCPSAECIPPCIKSGETCTCPAKNEKEACPEGCKCEGDTVTCPTTGIKPIEAKIKSASGTSKPVLIEKAEATLSIKTEKAVAVTTEKLVVEEDKLAIKTSSGNKEIKILPEEASSKAEIATVEKIELREENAKPLYIINGKKQAKVLGVFPATLKIESKVDAETGEVVSTSKPWWSFIAW